MKYFSVFIGWPNRAVSATLSSGSWTGLSNLNNSNYWEVARSTNVKPVNTVINIDIGSVKALRAVTLAAHNLSSQRIMAHQARHIGRRQQHLRQWQSGGVGDGFR